MEQFCAFNWYLFEDEALIDMETIVSDGLLNSLSQILDDCSDEHQGCERCQNIQACCDLWDSLCNVYPARLSSRDVPSIIKKFQALEERELVPVRVIEHSQKL